MTDRGIVTSSDLGTWDTIISDTGADNAGPGHRGKVSVSSVHQPESNYYGVNCIILG